MAAVRVLFVDDEARVRSGDAANLTSRLGELQPSMVFFGKPYDVQEIVAALNRMTVQV